ncbi:hypothetical protein PILCRDRAFT_624251 [Piloderma croceum F 1598]|uniref:Uncharacterized protein n=1 Tax=Piloderma croceum (strain F 1598) TaxID=765440 RepID=A0A0C3ATD3_PILCF|nr:hypothetical protein PILCRDRAFT_624251 [Piloderma croceum F 1598]
MLFVTGGGSFLVREGWSCKAWRRHLRTRTPVFFIRHQRPRFRTGLIYFHT